MWLSVKRTFVTPLIPKEELVCIPAIFESGMFLSLEAQKTLENQLLEYGNTARFHIYTEFKDDAGTLHKREYSASDFNKVSKIIYMQKQGVLPYLKKALLSWKSRKEQKETANGQTAEKQTNLRYEFDEEST